MVEDAYSNFRSTFAVTEGSKGGFVKVMSSTSLDPKDFSQSPKSIYQTGTMIRRDSLRHRYHALINKKLAYRETLETSSISLKDS